MQEPFSPSFKTSQQIDSVLTAAGELLNNNHGESGNGHDSTSSVLAGRPDSVALDYEGVKSHPAFQNVEVITMGASCHIRLCTGSEMSTLRQAFRLAHPACLNRLLLLPATCSLHGASVQVVLTPVQQKYKIPV